MANQFPNGFTKVFSKYVPHRYVSACNGMVKLLDIEPELAGFAPQPNDIPR